MQPRYDDKEKKGTQPGAMRVFPTSLLMVAGALLLGYLLGRAQPTPDSSEMPFKTRQSELAGWLENGLSSGASGAVWKAETVRAYTGSLPQLPAALASPPLVTGLKCDRWAVITTIFAPTKVVEQLADMPDWCLVVVGDKKTDKANWNHTLFEKLVVFLSWEDQLGLGYAITPLLKYNHFGRKNIGYLYALEHGAKVVWDTDDDNEFNAYGEGKLSDLAGQLSGGPAKEALALAEAELSLHVINPYPWFGAAHDNKPHFMWPRGFPLDFILDDRTTNLRTRKRKVRFRHVVGQQHVGVVQSLADHDPDVDAIFRLTKKLPATFIDRPSAKEEEALAMPVGGLSPFNAQATLWARASCWGLLLPGTVHGRVSDIWRSYVAQRLFWDVGQQLAFAKPLVTQFRNAHSYLGDFGVEGPLYSQAGQIARWLLLWQPQGKDLPARLTELYVGLFELGVVEIEDVQLVQAWLRDLQRVGYTFPPLTSTPFQPPASVDEAGVVDGRAGG